MLEERKVAGNRHEQRLGGSKRERKRMNGKFCEWDTREHCHRGCQNYWCLDKVLSAKPGYAGRVEGRKEAREAGTEKLTERFEERCWSESKSWNHSSQSKGQWDSRERKLLSLGSDQSKNQAHIHHGFTWLCGPGTSPPFLTCTTPVPPTPTVDKCPHPLLNGLLYFMGRFTLSWVVSAVPRSHWFLIFVNIRITGGASPFPFLSFK